MNINEYLMNNRDMERAFPWAPHIACVDGFSLSVQANYGAYCEPRQNIGPWTTVEVGFPSERPDAIMGYCENPDDPTETVYGYVPVEMVDALIDSHGGIKEKQR